MLVFVEDFFSFSYHLYDMVELFLQTAIIVSSNLHDLGLLRVELHLEFLYLRIQISEGV